MSNKRHVSHTRICSWRGATLSGQGVCRHAVFTCYLPANTAGAVEKHTFPCSVVCESSVRKILLRKKRIGLWVRTARKGCYFYILVFVSLRTLSGALAFIMECCTRQNRCDDKFDFCCFSLNHKNIFPLQRSGVRHPGWTSRISQIQNLTVSLLNVSPSTPRPPGRLHSPETSSVFSFLSRSATRFPRILQGVHMSFKQRIFSEGM